MHSYVGSKLSGEEIHNNFSNKKSTKFHLPSIAISGKSEGGNELPPKFSESFRSMRTTRNTIKVQKRATQESDEEVYNKRGFKVEVVTDTQLNYIYENIKNKKCNINSFKKNVPYFINESLNKQENTLHTYVADNYQYDHISNKISKLLNKEKDDLLMQKTDAYRAKKEVKELINLTHDTDELRGKYSW